MRLKYLIIGLLVLVALISGCVKQIDENFKKNSLITEEQAITIAKDAKEVQEFLDLYPNAYLHHITLVNGYYHITLLHNDENWTQTSFKVTIDSKSGNVMFAGKFPIEEWYCENDADCLCVPCSGIPKACCGCVSVINIRPFAQVYYPYSSYLPSACKCVETVCTILS